MKRFKLLMVWMTVLAFALLLGGGMTVRAEEEQVQTRTVDVSDLVFRAGGQFIPGDLAGDSVEGNEELKKTIYSALLNEESYVSISKFKISPSDIDEVKKLFSDILNEHSELFYVSPGLGYTYNSSIILQLNFDYMFTAAEKEKFGLKIEAAVALVQDGMTDAEKALVMHDYLAQNCSYAYKEYNEGTLDKVPHVFDAYGALVNGRAVCQGYTEAYRALLRAVGVDSMICTSSKMNHAWNLVAVDGKWYHVDVTWDDPVWNLEGRAKHIYFLLSDKEMVNRKHNNWTAPNSLNCSSTKYDSKDYWWYSVDSQIVIVDGSYYYISAEEDGKGFQLMERKDGSEKVVYGSGERWNVWGKPKSWYKGAFSYLSRQGDYLFFNDKLNLYAMKITGGFPQIIYTYNGEEGYIYGAAVFEDGTARLSIDTSPNRITDTFITIDLSDKLEFTKPVSNVYDGVDYSAVFNAQFYYDHNADVAMNVGKKHGDLLKHFVEKGMADGKWASEEFNLQIYKNNNADLVNAFGKENKSYYLHYIKYGKDEGRIAAEYISDGGCVSGDYSAVFDAGYYREHNADVVGVVGGKPVDLLKHFVSYGMSEGRQGSEQFDVQAYKDNNADLVAAFGGDKQKYYIHYIEYGQFEDRKAVGGGLDPDYYSAVFNADYYYRNNADVAKAFGNNPQALLQHFIDFGMSEGRQGSEQFDLQVYKNNYADLVTAFGGDNKNYYIHYIEFGKGEGRTAVGGQGTDSAPAPSGLDYSFVFDAGYYHKNHADLEQAFGDDGDALLRHFVDFGMREGRQGNEDFNVSVYKANNPDLQEAFGENLPAYYEHYIQFGHNEGRVHR